MRGYTERTKKLREQSVTTQPSVSLERALIETEFYEKYYGAMETPVLRALNFKIRRSIKSIIRPGVPTTT